ncbi:MAG: hypothetical protein ACT4QC_00900 [Planctomycetaceae bacterium]
MVTDATSPRSLAVGTGGILALMGIAWVVWSHLPPSQLKADEQVFKTVDALFTALTSRDRTRLDECERRLKVYREKHQLPDSAATVLDSIIAQARAGKWQPAAHSLYDFMLGQRGE